VQLSFRAKLLLILITAGLALVAVVAGSALIGQKQARDLADVEGRLIPRLSFGPRIETEFEHLRQGMQDAVAAQDKAALDATGETRTQLFELIANAGPALDPAAAARLRWAIQDYYQQAEAVSRRLIAGETGEALIEDIARMQERQRIARDVIRRTTGLDRQELSAGFRAVRNGSERADRFRLAIGLMGIALLLGLSFWLARGVLRTLEHISAGFVRFGTGDFRAEIPVRGNDELGRIARDANQMAASLSKLAEQRDRSDWLKTGQAGLSDEIRGELEPESVAERALSFLARRVRARAGAVYLSNEDGVLQLVARHAFGEESAEGDRALASGARSFRLGDGLVGQAALADELVVVDDLPAGYLKVRSGLGESDPPCLLLLPLVHLGKARGVLELALFKACSDEVRELLVSIRESLVIALEAAKSRSALRNLLEDAQQLAERLATQEEELRVNNHELRSQQEELRAANEELEAQRVALRAQNAELEEARRRVHQKAEELAKVSSYKSQFLANMSHELRTPLNSMLLLSQLLSENEGRNLTPKQVLHCKTIHSAGEDLLALINQVLDLAKIEAGRQDVDLELIALADFVAYARRMFEPMTADKGIALVTEIAEGMPETMTTDRQRVERILTNLIANAVKFTDRGQVSLRIERPKQSRLPLGAGARSAMIAFVVSDTGIGIPPEAHDRIFAPFEQVESRSDRRYAGTGLGLAITRESAELLGGELVLESSSSQGSVFVCYVPENAGAKAASTGHESSHEQVTAADDRAQLRPTSPHLLLIEDDKVLVEQLVDIVHACNFQALVAGNGDEGLRLAREHVPQGIILDIKLPGMDGWTVMERLRADPVTRSIPVHFISGVDAARRGLALGAIGYLTKPATHGELTAAVRALAPLANEQRRILVVEDSARDAEAMVELLGSDGLGVLRAESAERALQLISEEEFSCVILDLGLPGMDGIAMLEALRAQAPKKAPPIIVHTGRALTKQETRLLEAYADSVVMKGGSSGARLIEEVRLFVRHIEERLPRERKSDASELLRGGDVTLANVKILMAEDDIRTVYALSALLAGKGAEVLVAENGREALELLSKNTDVDAVLMDIMMPEMDGYDAMRELRKNPRFEALPVIALTAKAMKGERERCLEAGASDYLTKPVDSERLLSTLRDWLEPNVEHAARGN
jgi:CheY-like chemotaxis protein/signal transduction histidine kinase/HAMP domain-containing protein